MIDRIVRSVRRGVESLLPWYDPTEREARDRHTETLRKRAIRARVEWEGVVTRRNLDAYNRIRIER